MWLRDKLFRDDRGVPKIEGRPSYCERVYVVDNHLSIVQDKPRIES